MADATVFLEPSMLAVVFTFIIGLFGTSQKWLQARTKLKAAQNFLNELNIAAADGTITPEEVKRLILAAKAILN